VNMWCLGQAYTLESHSCGLRQSNLGKDLNEIVISQVKASHRLGRRECRRDAGDGDARHAGVWWIWDRIVRFRSGRV
jgi:hypothetical protein